ncbi:MAG: subtype I-E CRISPR-associated endonuclease Cas1, partial [bacterium]
AGGLQIPEAHEESIESAIPNKEGIGDVGHRD